MSTDRNGILPPVDDHRTATEESWTVGRLLNWTARYLAGRGAEFPRLDAEVLLAQALNCRRIELYTRYEETTADDTRQRFRELVQKRVAGCPVAYLVGRKEFFSLEFDVTPDVLIPRPDTECLVLECLQQAKEIPEPYILDVGTGSGSIAVVVAKQLPKARLAAVDLSPGALAVAERNANKHGVANRIRFFQGDLYEPLPVEERFDLIVSNPPYIAHEHLDQLPVGVREYEPHLALDGGFGGFAVFERILTGAGYFLKINGFLIVEIGAPQEVEARKRILSCPGFELGKTILDGSGHPRVLSARWRGR